MVIYASGSLGPVALYLVHSDEPLSLVKKNRRLTILFLMVYLPISWLDIVIVHSQGRGFGESRSEAKRGLRRRVITPKNPAL